MFFELQKSDVWAGKSPSSSIKSMKSDRDLPKSSLFTCFNHKPIINLTRHFFAASTIFQPSVSLHHPWRYDGASRLDPFHGLQLPLEPIPALRQLLRSQWI